MREAGAASASPHDACGKPLPEVAARRREVVLEEVGLEIEDELVAAERVGRRVRVDGGLLGKAQRAARLATGPGGVLVARARVAARRTPRPAAMDVRRKSRRDMPAPAALAVDQLAGAAAASRRTGDWGGGTYSPFETGPSSSGKVVPSSPSAHSSMLAPPGGLRLARLALEAGPQLVERFASGPLSSRRCHPSAAWRGPRSSSSIPRHGRPRCWIARDASRSLLGRLVGGPSVEVAASAPSIRSALTPSGRQRARGLALGVARPPPSGCAPTRSGSCPASSRARR